MSAPVEVFQTCQCIKHSHKNFPRKYPRDQVPEKLFIRTEKPLKFYKYCKDCRDHNNAAARIFRAKKISKISKDEFICGYCHKTLSMNDRAKNINGNDSSYCKTCKEITFNAAILRKQRRYKIITERILELKYCCEECKTIILFENQNRNRLVHIPVINKDGVYFAQVEGKEILASEYLKENLDRLAISILEHDHIPELEAREKGLLEPEENFVPKNGHVCDKWSEIAIRAEMAKTALVCGYCHLKKTISRENHTQTTSVFAREKYAYTNNLKKAGCSDCGFIDESLPRFFEFDHIDPNNKIIMVSSMTQNDKYTFEELIAECNKCRILCRYCHKFRTEEQNPQRNCKKKVPNEYTSSLNLHALNMVRQELNKICSAAVEKFQNKKIGHDADYQQLNDEKSGT